MTENKPTNIIQFNSEKYKKMQAEAMAVNPVIRDKYPTDYVDEDGKTIWLQHALSDIHEMVNEQVIDVYGNDWPRRIDRLLFAPKYDGTPMYIDSPNMLQVWLLENGIKIAFDRKQNNASSYNKYFEWLQQHATEMVNMAILPHFPAREGVYYSPYPLYHQGTGYFNELLNMFYPATELDRYLIKALFMTPFWGCAGGERPAFIITAEDDDEQGGRGVGKSKLTDALGVISGGSLDFSPSTDRAELTKRILTAKHQRIIRLDNVKSTRFGGSHFESLITAPEISGHRLYHGDHSVSNDFTWVYTYNDVNLSRDMAQRAVIIKLKRPPGYSHRWNERLNVLINEHRREIISDIEKCFQGETISVGDDFRFASWGEQVFGRLCPNHEMMGQLMCRQSEHDSEEGEAEEVRDCLINYLESLYVEYKTTNRKERLNSETTNVLIQRSHLAEVFRPVFGNVNSRTLLARLRRAFKLDNTFVVDNTKHVRRARFVLWHPVKSSNEFLVHRKGDYTVSERVTINNT